MKNKILFALIAAGATAVLAAVAFLPESLGGIGSIPVKVVALVVIMPVILGTATAQIYRATRKQPE